MTLEPVDPALDRRAPAVVDRVEMRRPAAAGAELLAVARLVGRVRDGAADPPATRIGAVLSGGVRLVRPDSDGPDAWPARPDAGPRTFSHTDSNCGESPRCPAVSTIDMGFWPCSTARCSLVVPAARASQRMITRLGEDPTCWLFLQVALLAGPGRVLMSAAHRGVDVQVPCDRTLRVGQRLEQREDLVPDAVPLPPAEQVIDPAPRSVLDGYVPPWNTGTDPEPYAVDQPPPGPHGWPPRLRPFRHHRPHTGISGHTPASRVTNLSEQHT
ncbi:hypothetical protein SUDANB1_03642 [Streptomyces sp. enrichment culture]